MRSFILILLLVCFENLHANTYYFSTISGDDSRSAIEAQNPSTPWKSLEKLNAIFSSLNPGDVLLLKRDEVFDGSLIISRSGNLNLPITLGAYGLGAKPVISGFTTATNWINTGSSIWETQVLADTMVNMVLVNGVAKAIGRYPNSNLPNAGYLHFESSVGNTQITDNELSSSPDWTGGEVVIRKERWVIDRNLITRHSGNTIQYNSESSFPALPNFGYFIQNHPQTLDLDGEWYYKVNGNKLGIYLPAGAGALKVQASTVRKLVILNNQSNIVFENLSFQGSNSATVEMMDAQHIRIGSCDILYSGINAVNAKNCTDITIENTEINHTNNVALNLDNCSYLVIRNNNIQNSGTIAGMGKGDSGSYEAVMISGDNVLIDHNILENTGYNPITFRGSANVISNNFINNFCMIKDDGSGIYTWNNYPGAPVTYGTKITNNMILNGIGAPEGTIWLGYRSACGIYMDDNVMNADINGNTAANCGLYGIYIHNTYNVNLQYNTFYNNSSQVVLTSDENARQSPVRNISMMNNIMVAKEYYQRIAEFKTYQNDITEFGTFDNNYYARPVDDNIGIYASFFQNGYYPELALTLDQWKALYGKDINSKKSPAAVASTDQIRFEYNSSSSAKSVALNGNYVDVKNQSYSGNITLQPYSSVVLIPKTGVTPPAISCPETGSILREQWNNITGNDISSIPLNQQPASTSQITSLEVASVGDNYGDRIRGYLCPPQTGNYTFLISGDDQVELWLSTDDNPANKTRIANQLLWTNFREFFKYPSQKSAPVTLQAGQRYYIEVLHKEGDGGDHVTVAWTLPNGGTQVPIPIDRLAPFVIGTPTPPTPSVSNSGLNYKYYEGNWDRLPDFSMLTPVKVGTTPNIDLSIRKVNDNFGVVWEGYINIPAPGNYTFETASDDGSKFYFNSFYSPTANALVNSDGLHPPQWASGTIYIPAAGSYPVAISYFESSGGESMQLYWTGPGIEKQLVPDAAFKQVSASTEQCSASGSILHELWRNVEGDAVMNIPQDRLPDIINQVTSLETSSLGDIYGERMRGYICPPTNGNYVFMLAGDDHVQLWLSSDDNPGNKTMIAFMNDWGDFHQFNKYPTQTSAAINLLAGHRYYIEVLHKQGYGPNHVTVAWQLPNGTTEIPIAGSHLSPFSSGTTSNFSGIFNQNSLVGDVTDGSSLQLNVSPNPFRTSANVRLMPVESGDATLELYNVQGVLIQQMFSGKVQSGVPKTLKLMTDGLSQGVYIIHLKTKTKVISQKVIFTR